VLRAIAETYEERSVDEQERAAARRARRARIKTGAPTPAARTTLTAVPVSAAPGPGTATPALRRPTGTWAMDTTAAPIEDKQVRRLLGAPSVQPVMMTWAAESVPPSTTANLSPARPSANGWGSPREPAVAASQHCSTTTQNWPRQ
jgi:hypothetical protein